MQILTGASCAPAVFAEICLFPAYLTGGLSSKPLYYPNVMLVPSLCAAMFINSATWQKVSDPVVTASGEALYWTFKNWGPEHKIVFAEGSYAWQDYCRPLSSVTGPPPSTPLSEEREEEPSWSAPFASLYATDKSFDLTVNDDLEPGTGLDVYLLYKYYAHVTVEEGEPGAAPKVFYWRPVHEVWEQRNSDGLLITTKAREANKEWGHTKEIRKFGLVASGGGSGTGGTSG